MASLSRAGKISPSDVKKIHFFITAIVVASVGLFSAKLVGGFSSLFMNSDQKVVRKTAVYKKTPKKDLHDFSNYEIIVTRNIFNSKNEIPDDDIINIGGNEAYKKTNLDIELVGTIVVNDATRSVAAIELKQEKKIEPFMIGDTILDKATVVSIARKKVVLRNNASGELEYVGMKDDDDDNLKIAGSDSGIKQVGSNRVLIERSELNKSLANFNELLTQARAVPNIENGVINGFKLFGVQPGSLYQKLGAQNGDIIKSVNGVDIKDPNTAMGLFQQLQTTNKLEFSIERGGEQKNFTVDIR
jgi:type II secretion system protein C